MNAKGKSMSTTPVPTPPTQISLSNLYPGSDHPDVAVFQAAIVRTAGENYLGITGVFDSLTTEVVKNFSQWAKDVGSEARLSYKSGIPNENFVRLVGLEIR